MQTLLTDQVRLVDTGCVVWTSLVVGIDRSALSISKQPGATCDAECCVDGDAGADKSERCRFRSAYLAAFTCGNGVGLFSSVRSVTLGHTHHRCRRVGSVRVLRACSVAQVVAWLAVSSRASFRKCS